MDRHRHKHSIMSEDQPMKNVPACTCTRTPGASRDEAGREASRRTTQRLTRIEYALAFSYLSNIHSLPVISSLPADGTWKTDKKESRSIRSHQKRPHLSPRLTTPFHMFIKKSRKDHSSKPPPPPRASPEPQPAAHRRRRRPLRSPRHRPPCPRTP